MQKFNLNKNRALTLSRGFTLIELLVVVAIIALLASVVFASLNSARAKSADASIKSQLAGMRSQAGIFYDNPLAGNNTYGAVGLCTVSSVGVVTPVSGVCTGLLGDTTFSNGIKAAAATSGTTLVLNVPAGSATWVAGVTLKNVSPNWFCVDSAGNSKTETAGTPATSITAPTIICP